MIVAITGGGDGRDRSARRRRLIACMLALLWLAVSPLADATRPLIPSCGMLYPHISSSTLPQLMTMLRTAQPRKAQCLIDQVHRFRSGALGPLVSLLHTGPEQVREYAAMGLRALGEQARPAVPDLQQALDDPSDSVRALVLDALTVIEPRSPALTQDLLRRLAVADMPSLTRDGLAQAMPRLGRLPAQALPVFVQALKRLPTNEDYAADMLIAALGHVDTPERVVALADLLADSDPRRRRDAVRVLGHSGLLALPVLLYRLPAVTGGLRETYREAIAWSWGVASSPALARYYQTDMTTLLRQLGDPRAPVRKQALRDVEGIAPAFQAEISEPWRDTEAIRIGYDLCNTLDVLDAEVARATDPRERLSIQAVASAIRQVAPYTRCHMPIY